MEKSQAVVVLGMHRSGTSMIAGVLSKLGINMGSDFIEESWANPLGHFEDISFHSLNRRILQAAGGRWDNPPSEKAILRQEPFFRTEIENLLNMQHLTKWGWKEPRTSLTIKLFLPHLAIPKFIIIHRNEHDIAKSLRRRDSINVEKGIDLSKIYYGRIEQFFEDHPELSRLDLSYEEVVEKPVDSTKNIVDFLGLKCSEKVKCEAINIISSKKDLRALSCKIKLKTGIKKPWKILPFLFKRLNRFY